MKRAALAALLVGLALLTALVVWRGVGPLLELVQRVGGRVAWLAPLYLAPLFFATQSWRLLFPPGGSPRLLWALGATWIGLAVNWLLPVAQVGGELAKADLVSSRFGGGPEVLASVVVDKTAQVATQVLYALVGLGLFASRYTDQDVLLAAAGGVLGFGLGAWGFYRVQRRGLFGLAAGAAERFLRAAAAADLRVDATATDEAVRSCYGRRGRLAAAVALRMAFRLALAGEVLLAAWWLDQPIGLVDALIIESLGQTVRAGSFLVPAGLGVQEGAFALLGAAVGLAPGVGLTISLCKRVRELTVGVPALVVWQGRLLRGGTG